jgi:hypothetical protein
MGKDVAKISTYKLIFDFTTCFNTCFNPETEGPLQMIIHAEVVTFVAGSLEACRIARISRSHIIVEKNVMKF